MDGVGAWDTVPRDAPVEEDAQAGGPGHGDGASTHAAGSGEGCAGAGGPPPAAQTGVARDRPDVALPPRELEGVRVGTVDGACEQLGRRRHKAGTSDAAGSQGDVGLASTGAEGSRHSSGGAVCGDHPICSARATQVRPKVPEEGPEARLEEEVSWSIPAAPVPDVRDSTSRVEQCRGAPGVPSSSVTLSRWGFVPQVGLETVGDHGGGVVRLAAAEVVRCFRNS